MDLRRLAQTNNATAVSSPRQATPATQPSTPKRTAYPIATSPLLGPSLSASRPFDWEAARSHRPPPYPSPVIAKRKAARKSEAGVGTLGAPTKRVVRKKSLCERLTSIPSRIAFEISIFPNNVPLPSPKTSAWLVGGLMHFLHFCVRVSQVRNVPDTDVGWEDMFHEDNDVSWFDWTVPVTALLVALASFNALFLFTHTKLYHMHAQPDPVSSPHARFVAAPADPPPLARRLRTQAWRAAAAAWRFLLGIGTSAASRSSAAESARRVQELEVWTPDARELALFCVYSPVHALLWTAWNSGNWILVACAMAGVSAQLRALTETYQALLKDRAIIAAEVMHEYDEKFVYPRVNPVRKDAAVMTNQAEIVNIWED
ncbi:hypothetical protein HETIRDRAFT_310986 [Heterobasidion irregulare TC 32-1]|uniref:Nuclear rim protein 1 n=1 Tax=Heterobasidion irregulare (strain TC 32-1) TaxID=747525 RepID=W4KLJ0_HETIT|nr:uncharacterized protein HETIRDRAFT_310986 [Heterobasidion irregulare TC 32-1]ETW85911.1 hypothetical protein HETIRDRAFT_310986 [Heterobasidion irregulare TC 32-1]